MVNASFGEARGDLLAVWARDRMDLGRHEYHKDVQTVKNLEKIWADRYYSHSVATTLLLDDSPAKAILQPYNHIVVGDYTQESRAHDLRVHAPDTPETTPTPFPRGCDDTLLAVVGILDTIKSQTNVARWIRFGGLQLRESDQHGLQQEPWFQRSEVREHWRVKGVRVLAELGIRVAADVIP
ncbi:hypothetical protein H0H81_011502 [Sphagnurus paluster]|uniref:FCP1 homology domain-containing protein n=1 Tax=Sphagnurus paluster TaxID=117069 RepID=A0A9P7FU30_9AGAR|nr:hypothetical protein H0H81_011502 [Sphagnurus paluster]